VLITFSPDFRWLLDRTDSPWYPTMRLFRQSAIGDWDSPLDRLRKELSEVAAARAIPAHGTLLMASSWPRAGVGATVRPEAP